jgi:hypothetical protein
MLDKSILDVYGDILDVKKTEYTALRRYENLRRKVGIQAVTYEFTLPPQCNNDENIESVTDYINTNVTGDAYDSECEFVKPEGWLCVESEIDTGCGVVSVKKLKRNKYRITVLILPLSIYPYEYDSSSCLFPGCECAGHTYRFCSIHQDSRHSMYSFLGKSVSLYMDELSQYITHVKDKIKMLRAFIKSGALEDYSTEVYLPGIYDDATVKLKFVKSEKDNDIPKFLLVKNK